jgi:polygalacturonase
VHDDTTALQAAIASGKTVFVPSGQYLCSDTLRLPSGTRVLGEQFPMIFLKPSTAGFGDRAAPKALLETDDDPLGVVQLVGLWISAAGYSSRGEGNAGAVLVSWRCGGTGAGIWDTLLLSSAVLWGHVRVSGGGGGIIDNVWSPGATNLAGFTAEGTTRPLLMLGTMFEHHTVVAYNIQNCENITLLVMQTENSPLAFNVSDSTAIEVFGAIFTDWSEGRPSLTTLHHCAKTTINALVAFNTSSLVLSTEPTFNVQAGFGGWRDAILVDM